MFFFNKKIRQLNQDLDANKKPQDLDAVVREVENLSPAAANPAFKKTLRQKLLLKYNTMAVAQKEKSAGSSSASSNSPMRKKPWAWALAVLVIFVVGGVGGYPLIPAPEVQGYSLRGAVRKIAYNAPIKVVFSQPMDHGSVEKTFRISPQTQGTLEWQGNSLLFKPAQQFKVGDVYKVSIDHSAKSIFQKSLNSDYEENYEIVAAPQVALFSPAADSVDVPVDAKLTVHFDRPMIPLTSLDQSNEMAIQMKIDPPIMGKAKWLGTSSMSFVPEKLTYATHYTVTIPQGTVSAEGGATDKDFVYSFDTLRPSFVSSSVSDLNPYSGPDTFAKLDFNEKMSLEKARDFVKIYRYNGDAALAKKIQWATGLPSDGPVKAGMFTLGDDFVKAADPSKWEEIPTNIAYYTVAEYKKDNAIDENNTQQADIPTIDELQKSLVVKPAIPLADETVYRFAILKDFPGAEGSLSLIDGKNFVIKTAGALAITSTNPADNEKDFAAQAVNFYTNQPMDLVGGIAADAVTIVPKSFDDNKNEVKPQISAPAGYGEAPSVDVMYPFLPSTSYTVTLKQGTKSTYGKILDHDVVLKFTTAALKPTFHLVSTPDISIVDGSKPRVYYIRATNIDTVHVAYKKLSDDEFKAMYGQGYVGLKNRPGGAYLQFDKKVAHEFNKSVTTKLDLERDSGQPFTSGGYYMEVTNPAVLDDDGKVHVDTQFFVVTKYALATKISQHKLLVWATSMQEGKPVAGMEIRANSSSDSTVLTGTTDADGLVSFNLPTGDANAGSAEFAVAGKLGDEVTFAHTTWSDGVAPWNFNISYSYADEKYYVFLYTDRPIYRPGHTVYFKGLVRVNNDLHYSLPDRNTVHVTITDSNAQDIYSKDLPINKNGTFNGEMNIGEQAATGDFRMTASFADERGPDYAHESYQYFKVAAYRKPDYNLMLTSDKDNYVNGETAKIKVDGQFFFGAPLKDGKVTWTVKSEDYYFFLNSDSKSPYASDWFSFSDEGFSCYWGCTGQTSYISTGQGKLDADGKYTIELPLNVSDKKLSQIYTVEATVEDLNHQTVSNRTSFPVHRGDYYVGIRSEDSIATKGKEAKFDVITVDKDGNPVGGRSVDVSLMKREWNTIQKKNVDSDFYYDNNFTDTLKEKKTVQTDGQGHALVGFTVQEGGDYKVLTASVDGHGNSISSATNFYVTTGEFVNWGMQNNDRIELVPDKQEYKIGDTAHVLIKSPYTNVYALVTSERGDVVSKKVMKITSNSQTIDVPITEKSLPNEFVSVLLVKGNNTAAGLPDPGKDPDERNVATFKLGYTTLQVDTSSRKLNLDIKTDREKYHPQDEVHLNIHTTNAAGKGVAAEVSVGVVDKSVLSLTQNVTADLLSSFYRMRFLGVSTAETLTKALSRINVQVESGLKGGGGGGSALVRGIFKDTAYWQAVVNTDANGNGEVKFKLPDNLTTWQVMVIGITPDTLVGSQTTEFKVNKDVLNRPVLPRFLIVNDSMTIGTLVHNYLDHGVDVDVSLKATGVRVNGSDSQRIHLDSREEKRVDFAIDVLDQPEAAFSFSALVSSDTSIGDVVEMKVPIHTFSFPEVVASSMVVNDASKYVETVWLPTGIDPKFGKLTISVASTFAGTFAKGVEYLVQFPYGCAEQTASALLSNLVVKELAGLPGLGVNKLIDSKILQKNVEVGLQALYKYQQSDGGWGLWENSQTSPYLSAYVLFTLDRAQKAGYAVDGGVLKRGEDYLRSSMMALPLTVDVNSWSANQRAFMLFVMAEMNKGDLGLTNNTFDQRKALSLFGKAYLAMAFDDLQKQKVASVTDAAGKINILKGEIIAVAKETPRGVHFEEQSSIYEFFDTNRRTTALVLQMLSRVDSGNVLIPKILRDMLMAKKDGHYETTQETAVSLLAFAEYLKASKELEPNFNGVVTVNGAEKMNKGFGVSNLTDVQTVDIPLSDLLPNNADNEITATRNGSGKMYVDMNLKYYLPTEKIQPRDEGIFVTQDYYKMDDAKLANPVTSVKVGENLVGKMTVIVPEERYYVMVEDFLPAGLEGVDFDLQTSDQSLQAAMENGGAEHRCETWDCWMDLARFNHKEVRDDRMMFFADYLPAGVYELKYVVRATTAGKFHDLPALAQETYFPEVFGRSAGREFEVAP